MRLIVGVFICCLSFSVQGQNSEEEQEIRKTIETFFEGFHERDSVMIKSVSGDELVMQTIAMDEDGEPHLEQSDFSAFLRSIVGIPEKTSFKEELHSFEIQTDGMMANVWTPYSLFIDGTLSHCGVNNFLLIKSYGQWRIIYLIDTRSREACEHKME